MPGWEPFDNDSSLNYYFGKVTTQLSSKHQLLAFYQRDINPEESSSATTAREFSATAFGGSAYNARLSSVWNNSLTSRVSVSYNDKSFNRDVDGRRDHGGEPGRALFIHQARRPQFGALIGTGVIASLNNVSEIDRSPTTKLTLQGDVTWYRTGWLGAHEFQTGFFLQPVLTSVNESFYSNDGFAIEEAVLIDPTDLSGGYIPFSRTIYDVADAITGDTTAGGLRLLRPGRVAADPRTHA